MQENSVVQFIPAKPPKQEKRVGIYARVSTNGSDQLKSLTNQVSGLTKLVAATPQWLLEDIYMDISSSMTGSIRRELNRMLDDCHSRKLDIILTKSISRFGRDTVGLLELLAQLKALGVRVIFEKDNLDTSYAANEVVITAIESLAQAENESRSADIKWGIKKRAEEGTSKLYDRKCYGYKHDADGKLIIDNATAENVRMIFDLYLSGKSVIGIVKELERLEIKSPKGNDKWCKRSVDVMLSNEKYIGNVHLLDKGEHEDHYLSKNNNPAIISKETFQAVQIEKAHRSNVTKDADGNRRKGTKYSSKK